MRSTSVIIPAYNSQDSLGEAIDSALSQSLPAQEIIVIDDGSTDATVAVARGYGDRVRLIEQTNQGQGAARNAGLAIATGRFVAFLDADDYWRPEFLARMERFLDKHPQAVAASSAFLARRKKGDYTGPAGHEALLARYPEGLMLPDFFTFWAEKDHVRTGTALIRRSAIDEVGFQNPALRISQDLEYWALVATAGPWGLVPEILWVGGSDRHARSTGWRKKYAARRKRTPTVEAWQERVLARLSPDQIAAFSVVRGRVASGYALSQLLGGDLAAARKIVQTYGGDMPNGLTPRVMKLANRLGPLGWQVGALALQLYDRTK